MSSEEIKEQLDGWLEEYFDDGCYDIDVEKAIGKWKRLKKSKNENGQWERIFNNTYLNKKVLVIEDNIIGFFADKNYVFHIDSLGNIAVSDYEYFKKEKCQSDWHLSIFVNFPNFVSEEMEGCFSSEKSISETRDALIKFGFVEDQNFSEFIENVGS